MQVLRNIAANRILEIVEPAADDSARSAAARAGAHVLVVLVVAAPAEAVSLRLWVRGRSTATCPPGPALRGQSCIGRDSSCRRRARLSLRRVRSFSASSSSSRCKALTSPGHVLRHPLLSLKADGQRLAASCRHHQRGIEAASWRRRRDLRPALPRPRGSMARVERRHVGTLAHWTSGGRAVYDLSRAPQLEAAAWARYMRAGRADWMQLSVAAGAQRSVLVLTARHCRAPAWRRRSRPRRGRRASGRPGRRGAVRRTAGCGSPWR